MTLKSELFQVHQRGSEHLGSDKLLKYPTIFNTADLALLSKTDLAEAVEFDCATAEASVQAVGPAMQLLEVSAKTGQRFAPWVELLEARGPASGVAGRQASLT